jgi:hypothetical protein
MPINIHAGANHFLVHCRRRLNVPNPSSEWPLKNIASGRISNSGRDNNPGRVATRQHPSYDPSKTSSSAKTY